MQLQDIQNIVASLMDDLNQTYFTAPQVLYFINNAQRAAQKVLLAAGSNFYTKCITAQNAAPYQQDLVLPSDFYKVQRIETVDNMDTDSEQRYPISPMTINQQDFIYGKYDRPENYILKRSHFSFFPIPDIVYQFRMFYAYRVADMVNPTDTPDVPLEYHEYLVICAALDCRIKDDRMVDSLMAKKLAYETEMQKDSQNRNIDRARSVVVTSDESMGSFL